MKFPRFCYNITKNHNFITGEIIDRINYIYYKDNPSKHALKELGVFDRDIEYISKIIEIDNLSLSDLQLALKLKFEEIQEELSFVSRYIIKRML